MGEAVSLVAHWPYANIQQVIWNRKD